MSDVQRSGVLCIGTSVVDVGKVIDVYPTRDHLAFIEEISLSTGGGGLNMAVDLRQLGATYPIEFIAAVGHDEYGDYIRSECARLDIETSRIRTVAGANTSFTDVMVECLGGRRTFFHHVGANARFLATPDDVRQSTARILHIGAPGVMAAMDETSDDRNGWRTLVEAARDLGMHTNLELSSVAPDRLREIVLPFLPSVNSVIINEFEAGGLTGIDYEAPAADAPPDWDTLEQMAHRLIDAGVQTLAVVHVPAGAVAADADGRVWRQPSVSVPPARVRSTTGAGDAFAAGVVFGLHDGWSVEAGLRLGAGAAAACLLSTHTSAGITSADACLRLAEEFGFRDRP